MYCLWLQSIMHGNILVKRLVVYNHEHPHLTSLVNVHLLNVFDSFLSIFFALGLGCDLNGIFLFGLEIQ